MDAPSKQAIMGKPCTFTVRNLYLTMVDSFYCLISNIVVAVLTDK